MPEYELLDTRPEPERGVRWSVVAVLAVLAAGALLYAGVVRDDGRPDPACREERGAAWCTAPSEAMTDVALVRLVHGYCPQLRERPLAEVAPQPLADVGLPARPGELVLRTQRSGARVESGLLGRPDGLAWVVRRIPRGGRWDLQVVCHNGPDRVPALELDSSQLDAALRADAGKGGLDLRVAARLTARAVRVTPTGRVSLGTFRCRTTSRSLALEAASRFDCSLPLFSDHGQAVHRVTYEVRVQPPYLRPVL